MEVGVPGRRGDLDGSGSDCDAGARARKELDTATIAATIRGTTETRILKRNMSRYSLNQRPPNTRVYGCRSVKKTRYRLVDGAAF